MSNEKALNLKEIELQKLRLIFKEIFSYTSFVTTESEEQTFVIWLKGYMTAQEIIKRKDDEISKVVDLLEEKDRIINELKNSPKP